MSGERRYNEEEIKAIFKQAAAEQEAARQNLPSGGGLTLEEIEDIGKEAGITPEFIARAAASMAPAIPTPPPVKVLGFPISATKIADLPGSFSDKDWDRLVADLHDTYQVPGEQWREGSVRHWRRGRLHVLVEPHNEGHRLRMFNKSDGAASALSAGAVFFLMGLFFLALLAAKGGQLDDLGKVLFVSGFSVAGLGAFGFSVFRLPRWRKEQEEKMTYIATRAASRLEKAPTASLAEPEASGRISLDEEEEIPDAEPVAAKRRTHS